MKNINQTKKIIIKVIFLLFLLLVFNAIKGNKVFSISMYVTVNGVEYTQIDDEDCYVEIRKGETVTIKVYGQDAWNMDVALRSLDRKYGFIWRRNG